MDPAGRPGRIQGWESGVIRQKCHGGPSRWWLFQVWIMDKVVQVTVGKVPRADCQCISTRTVDLAFGPKASTGSLRDDHRSTLHASPPANTSAFATWFCCCRKLPGSSQCRPESLALRPPLQMQQMILTHAGWNIGPPPSRYAPHGHP